MYEDLLNYTLDYALGLGAGYAEARYQRDVGESIILKNGVPEVSASSVSRGISVRVLVGNALGFASTSELNRAAVRRMVKDAVAMARAASKVLGRGVRMGPGKLSKGRVEVKPRVRWEVVDIEAKTEYLKEADSLAVETCEKRGG